MTMSELSAGHAPAVYRCLLAWTRNPSLAEDLTAETFYRAIVVDQPVRAVLWGQDIGKRELIDQQLGRLSESDLDRLLEFLRTLNEEHAEAAVPALAAESSLANDWLSPEEDAAWANL